MDIEERIFNKLDKIESAIAALCRRLTEVEVKYQGHIDDLKEKQTNKEKKFYVIIALMGITFTAYQVITSLL